MACKAPTPTTFISAPGIARMFDVSRETVWRWVASGRLPQPIDVAPSADPDARRVPRWKINEVETYIAEQAAKRKAALARKGGRR